MLIAVPRAVPTQRAACGAHGGQAAGQQVLLVMGGDRHQNGGRAVPGHVSPSRSATESALVNTSTSGSWSW